MKQKERRARVYTTLTRWAERLVKERSLPVLLLGLGEDENDQSDTYTLCCVDVEPEALADVLRRVLGELERQIFEAACREGK